MPSKALQMRWKKLYGTPTHPGILHKQAKNKAEKIVVEEEKVKAKVEKKEKVKNESKLDEKEKDDDS